MHRIAPGTGRNYFPLRRVAGDPDTRRCVTIADSHSTRISQFSDVHLATTSRAVRNLTTTRAARLLRLVPADYAPYEKSPGEYSRAENKRD